MKSILLIGIGRFGKHIAIKLNELEQEVMAIDYNEEHINEVLPFVTGAQIGDSTNEEFMRSLGIRNFDVCIVAIGDNFQNSLETAYLLKELGAKKVIARAARSIQEKFLLRNGADEVVYPEKELGKWTAVRCTSEHFLNYVELGDDYSIFEIPVPSKWAGRSIVKLDVRNKFGINILGLRCDGKMQMNFNSDAILQKNMTMLVLGRQREIKKCFHID